LPQKSTNLMCSTRLLKKTPAQKDKGWPWQKIWSKRMLSYFKLFQILLLHIFQKFLMHCKKWNRAFF